MFKEMNNLVLFLENPNKSYNVREVASLLKISPATASKYLQSFMKKGLLKYHQERMLDLYQANVENPPYRDLKIYYNITKIRESGLLDAFDQFYLKPTIIFFGSGAHGYNTHESDFDFVVISEKTKDFSERDIFEKKLRCELQIFAVKRLKDLRNEHLINNVLSGILLQGEIKWI
ncbi:nucleotidyltransferase domain-containing protein [Candidatus Woesearchaeota archaeon]|nr:nucleotidyltransferase domain-containing protein [Candidatus Woesearchaeota archaeon]